MSSRRGAVGDEPVDRGVDGVGHVLVPRDQPGQAVRAVLGLHDDVDRPRSRPARSRRPRRRPRYGPANAEGTPTRPCAPPPAWRWRRRRCPDRRSRRRAGSTRCRRPWRRWPGRRRCGTPRRRRPPRRRPASTSGTLPVGGRAARQHDLGHAGHPGRDAPSSAPSTGSGPGRRARSSRPGRPGTATRADRRCPSLLVARSAAAAGAVVGLDARRGDAERVAQRRPGCGRARPSARRAGRAARRGATPSKRSVQLAHRRVAAARAPRRGCAAPPRPARRRRRRAGAGRPAPRRGGQRAPGRRSAEVESGEHRRSEATDGAPSRPTRSRRHT